MRGAAIWPRIGAMLPYISISPLITRPRTVFYWLGTKMFCPFKTAPARALPAFSCAILLAAAGGCSNTFIGQRPHGIEISPEASSGAPGEPEFERSNWMRDTPTCKRNFGTVALLEADNEFMGPGGPQNATPMLRYLIQKSGCFTVVDRGQAISKLDTERTYSDPPRPAGYRPMDYLMTARVVFQETRTSDGSVSAASTSTHPGGSWGFGWNLSASVRVIEMNAVVLLTDARSSIQVLAEQGSAVKTEANVNAYSGFGFDSLSSKTMSAALFDGYARLVAQMNASPDIMKRRYVPPRPAPVGSPATPPAKAGAIAPAASSKD